MDVKKILRESDFKFAKKFGQNFLTDENLLDDIVLKSGVSENTVKQVSDALEARELIKLRTLETCPTTPRETAEEIAEKTGADVVQVIGSRFVLYKESEENKQIKLVK